MTTDMTLTLARSDATLVYRRRGEGPPLLLLHATLSSSRQLRPLADLLAPRFTVLSVDRRGSGGSVAAGSDPPVPIDVATHVDDLVALLEAEGLGAPLVVGHSYGGCLGLELAARRPDVVRGLWAYEPPFAPAAPPAVRRRMAEIARRTLAANVAGGPAAAAETFMVEVSGRPAWESLTPAGREAIRREGRGAVADAPLQGLDADGLTRVACPVLVATGGASQPVYVAIAEGLRRRIPTAVVEPLVGLEHMAPVTRPDRIAAAVEAFADR